MEQFDADRGRRGEQVAKLKEAGPELQVHGSSNLIQTLLELISWTDTAS